MRNLKPVAFLLAIVLCAVFASAAFADAFAEGIWTEELLDGLYAKGRELLEAEGYSPDSYPGVNVETVDDVCWITFTEKDRTLRCDLSADGNALYLYNSDYDQRKGSAVDHPFVKPEELMQATQKMKNFLRKNHPALLERVDRLALDRLIVQGTDRYLVFSDGEWQGLNFVIRTSPALRIEYFHAPV